MLAREPYALVVPRRPTAKRATGADGATTVRGKRANGRGSVYFDRANGCYFATWRDSDGKRRKVRGRTQAESERRCREAIDEHARTGRLGGSPFTEHTTLHEFSAWWLANVAPHRMRPSSVRTVSNRLTPNRLRLLADSEVAALTPKEVQEWQSELLRGENTLSPSTVADTRVTLNQVLDCAVDHRLIAENPAKRVKPPRVPKSTGRHLDLADARRLVAACSGARCGAAVAILFTQGWRVSEVLGLAWSDLDLDAKEPTARIRRAVVEAGGVGRSLGPPKTEGAEGVHYLLPGVVERLRAHRATQASERLTAGTAWQTYECDGERLDLVFTTDDGGLVGRQHIDKLVRAEASALGMDTTGLGTHVGRRTVVTAMSEHGVPVDDIARHVGHSSSTTTARYIGSHIERDKATARRAASILDFPARPDRQATAPSLIRPQADLLTVGWRAMGDIDVDAAAGLLGVSGRQVRRLIDRGDIAASRFGASWAIDRESVYRYRDLRPNRGRPLSPDRAWRAILQADIHSLDHAHQLAIVSRRRADRVAARVATARMDTLIADRRVVESGVGAAARLGAAVDVRPPFQVYMRQSDWGDIEREYRVDRAHSEPNVLFRVATDEALDGLERLPRSVVLVDLVSEREHRVARELMRVSA